LGSSNALTNCDNTESQEITWIHKRELGFTRESVDSQEGAWIHKRKQGFTTESMDSQQRAWIQTREREFTREGMAEHGHVNVVGFRRLAETVLMQLSGQRDV